MIKTIGLLWSMGHCSLTTLVDKMRVQMGPYFPLQCQVRRCKLITHFCWSNMQDKNSLRPEIKCSQTISITWLPVHQSQDYLCTNHRTTCAPITGLPVHQSQDYLSTNHRTTCAPITGLPVHQSHDYLCTNHRTTCAPITGLPVHQSQDYLCSLPCCVLRMRVKGSMQKMKIFIKNVLAKNGWIYYHNYIKHTWRHYMSSTIGQTLPHQNTCFMGPTILWSMQICWWDYH